MAVLAAAERVSRVARISAPATPPNYGELSYQFPDGLPESALAAQLDATNRQLLIDAWRHGLPANRAVRFARALTPEQLLPMFLPTSTWSDPFQLSCRLNPYQLMREVAVSPQLVGDNLVTGLGFVDPREPRTRQADWIRQKGARSVVDGLRLAFLSAQQLDPDDTGVLVVDKPTPELAAMFPEAGKILQAAYGSLIIMRKHITKINGVTKERDLPMFFTSCRSAARMVEHERNKYADENFQIVRLMDDLTGLVSELDTGWRRRASDEIKNALVGHLTRVVNSGNELLGRCVNPLKVDARQALSEASAFLTTNTGRNPRAALSLLLVSLNELRDRVVEIAEKQGYGARDGNLFNKTVVQAERWFDEVRRDLLDRGYRAIAELRVSDEERAFLQVRPFRAYARALLVLGNQIRYRAENYGNTDRGLQNRVNKVWTVLRLEAMHRGIDEVQRLLTYRPAISPLLLFNALQKPHRDSAQYLLHPEIGMRPNAVTHRMMIERFNIFHDDVRQAKDEYLGRARWTHNDSITSGTAFKERIEDRMPSPLFELGAWALGH